MNLTKSEYANILALLHRVELKGLNEAKEVVTIGFKIEQKIKNWVEGKVEAVRGVIGEQDPEQVAAPAAVEAPKAVEAPPATPAPPPVV